MLNALQKLWDFVVSHSNAKKPTYDLIIYDDIYPHPASGFRMEEFTYLLESFDNSKIILSGTAYQHFNLSPNLHQAHINLLLKHHPTLHNKIVTETDKQAINAKLFYCVFLHNTLQNLPWLEKKNIPFVFTLYPGGSFDTSSQETINGLKKIFASRCFRKVVVTQQKTVNYLVDNKFCKQKDMIFVFGVVTPQGSINGKHKHKQYYGTDKSTFDICFCAQKYTRFGEDKGYPLFVDFMKATAPKYPFLKFHIIGGFDKEVIDVEAIEDRIQFYGSQDFDNLREIFQQIDLIISPNQPGKLSRGAFDGFPLGTVIEAALNEVVVMLTDFFKENVHFEDGKELIIIQPDLDDIISRFEALIQDLDLFYKIAKAGSEKFARIYSNDYQMTPRVNLLKSLIHPGL